MRDETHPPDFTATNGTRRSFLQEVGAAVAIFSSAGCARVEAGDAVAISFKDRLGTPTWTAGYRDPGYFVWGASCVKGEDGRYHLFASRWSTQSGFWSWLTNSQVVRASSDTPEGPFIFEEVVFEDRPTDFFDAKATHNPTILKHQGTYYLFYMGVNYDFPRPQKPSDLSREQYFATRWNQRIGVATSSSVTGPWKRLDEPILSPRPGEWDQLMTTNPAPAIRDDGSVVMIYKSAAGDREPLLLGVASAPHPTGPYSRLSEKPIELSIPGSSEASKNASIEDAYIWWNGRKFEMILKDHLGQVTGKDGVGIHATSSDGISWVPSEPAIAYEKSIVWSDGRATIQANVERPQLLIENGRPTHLYLATGEGPSQFQFEGETWNMVIPLTEPIQR